MNNYEKIKNMSIEEIKKFLEFFPACHSVCAKERLKNCDKCPAYDINQWLQQEAE